MEIKTLIWILTVISAFTFGYVIGNFIGVYNTSVTLITYYETIELKNDTYNNEYVLRNNIDCPTYQDYALWEFVDNETTAKQRLIRIRYNERCYINTIHSYNIETNTFELVYFKEGVEE